MGIMRKNGFTVVELVLVVTIIAILSAIVVVGYNGLTARARDSERIAILNDLNVAIKDYYKDNGQYPAIIHGRGDETSCGSQTENWGHCDRLKSLTDALAPYATYEPEDLSSATQGNYYYTYDSQNDDSYQTYGLMVYLEGDGGADDGGYYANGYELGQNPVYCSKTYTGANADWLNTSGVWNQRCGGGN